MQAPEGPALRLLSREDCHLCEIAQRDLDILGLRYEVVDIDQDVTLQERYGETIPVLVYGEVEVARAPMDRQGIRQALNQLKLTGGRK